jgi:hypothetical protein
VPKVLSGYSFKNSSLSKTDVMSNQKSLFDSISDIKTSINLASASKVNNMIGVKSSLASKSGLVQGVSQVQSSKQSQVQSQVQMQAQVQSQLSLQKQISVQTQMSKVVKLPELSSGVFGKGERNNYGVQVKSKGSFKTLGTGLSLKNAISLGSGRVGQTSARSFRIVSNNQVVKNLNLNNFYNKGGTLIERSKFAINTPGERSEISYSGIRISRLRGK